MVQTATCRYAPCHTLSGVLPRFASDHRHGQQRVRHSRAGALRQTAHGRHRIGHDPAAASR